MISGKKLLKRFFAYCKKCNDKNWVPSLICHQCGDVIPEDLVKDLDGFQIFEL